ncbi:hypothetical protein B4U80_12349, partial [Leptotrombidium deliense]
DSWIKYNRVLGTREIVGSKTGAKIKELMIKILKDYECENLLVSGETIVVTDNGANVKKACSDYEWISCAAHNIQLSLKHAFEKIDKRALTEVNNESDNENIIDEDNSAVETDLSNPAEITTLVLNVKRIVKWLKKSDNMSKLSKKIPQAISTRWNS